MDESGHVGRSRGTNQAVRPWWRWGGAGWKTTLDEIRFVEVLAVLLVGFTIWGYADIRKRGRIVGDHPELHRTDFTVFTAAAEAFRDGREPYEARNPRGWFYLYPPLFALLVAPLVVFDSVTQVVLWYVGSLGCALGCYFEGRKLWSWLSVGNVEPRPAVHRRGLWLGLFTTVAVVLPLFECLQRGQLGIALLWPLLVGARWVLENRSAGRVVLGGVLLALPVAIKLVPALPVACLLGACWVGALTRPTMAEWRRSSGATVGLALGLVLFFLVVPAVVLGWSANLGHLRTWYGKVAANQEVGQQHGFHIDSLSNQSLTNALYLYSSQVGGTAVDRAAYRYWLLADTEAARRRAADEAARHSGYLARGAYLLLLGLAVVQAGRSRDRLALATVFALSILGIVVVSPLAWTHYFVFWMPATLLVPAWCAREGRPRLALGMAVAPALATWLHFAGPRFFAGVGLLGLATLGWSMVGLIALVRPGNRVARSVEGWRHDGVSAGQAPSLLWTVFSETAAPVSADR